MSKRVYPSKTDCRITQEQDTPVSIRRQRRRATVKDLPHRLPQAYRRDEARLVRRITVVLALLVPHVPVARVWERWGLSPACL